MAIFLFWLIFSVVLGAMGSSRSIGFAGAFFVSLLLSPIIGLIVVLVSKEADANPTQGPANDTPVTGKKSLAEELESLLKLKDAGQLTEEEYELLRRKAVASFS